MNILPTSHHGHHKLWSWLGVSGVKLTNNQLGPTLVHSPTSKASPGFALAYLDANK